MTGARPWVEEAVDPEEDLAGDSRLLAAASPASRVRTVGRPFVSIGVAEREDGEAARRARALGLPVLRRSSGGTGLLHLAGDFVWSIVLPRTDPRVGRDYARAYHRLGSEVQSALTERGIPAAWTPAPGVDPHYCLLAPRGDVISVGGRALGGAAQHLTATALLHHGTLNVRLDRAQLADLFGLPVPLTERHLTSLTEAAPALDVPALGERLARALARWVDG